jgi:capsular exopolysaccharide synthesis family protein
MGLLLGVGLAFFLEYLDSRVKTAEDIELYVKLPFLGYVPSVKTEVRSARETKDIDLICSKVATSRIAEAYRSIRTSIIFSSPEDRPLKTILITSTSPREGKTTVSSNLGQVFATANERTLIVEADMRRPRIGHSFGLANKAGLSSFLAGTTSLEESILKTAVPNLFIMPSGPKPPNPAELLTSTKTRTLFGEMRGRFDRIIVDSPPVMTVADTAILANIVDGVIYVILASFLNVDAIIRGRQRLYEAKAKVIGTILNNVNVKKEDSYYYYHYYYADDKGKQA